MPASARVSRVRAGGDGGAPAGASDHAGRARARAGSGTRRAATAASSTSSGAGCRARGARATISVSRPVIRRWIVAGASSRPRSSPCRGAPLQLHAAREAARQIRELRRGRARRCRRRARRSRSRPAAARAAPGCRPMRARKRAATLLRQGAPVRLRQEVAREVLGQEHLPRRGRAHPPPWPRSGNRSREAGPELVARAAPRPALRARRRAGSRRRPPRPRPRDPRAAGAGTSRRPRRARRGAPRAAARSGSCRARSPGPTGQCASRPGAREEAPSAARDAGIERGIAAALARVALDQPRVAGVVRRARRGRSRSGAAGRTRAGRAPPRSQVFMVATSAERRGHAVRARAASEARWRRRARPRAGTASPRRAPRAP